MTATEPIDVNNPRPGWYRIKNPLGRMVPVRYVYTGDFDDLECFIDGVRVEHHRAIEQWPWASKNPVTHQAYEAVLAGAPWPDIDPVVAAATNGADRTAIGGNNPPPGEELPPEAQLAAKVTAALAGLAAYVTWDDGARNPKTLIANVQRNAVVSLIKADDALVKAQTLRDMLLGYKSEAEKSHKIEKQPYLDGGRKVDRKWFDVRDLAEAAANALRSAMSAHETAKLHRQQAEAAAAQEAELKARVATATKEAETTGKPVVVIAPLPPAPIAPAPAKIKGASGRAASSTTVTVVKEVADWPALFQYFRLQDDVQAILIKHANAALKAGNQVPGIVTHQVREVK